MKKLLFLLLIAAAFSAQASAQVDSNWYAIDNNYVGNFGSNPWCFEAAQAGEASGFLTLTMATGSFTCQSNAASYKSGGVVSQSFSFTYGVAKASIRFGNPGDPPWTAFWMLGGASGSSGYPPTCVASLKAGGTAFSTCASSAQTSYEIDIAEAEATDSQIHQNLFLWQSNTQVAGGQQATVNSFSPSSQGYHVYELDWYPSELIFKIDGAVTTTMAKTVSVPMFLIIDQEAAVLPSTFPTTTSVDWVRVCSDPNAACLPGDATMVFDDEFGSTPAPTPIPNQKQGWSGQGVSEQ